MDKYQTAWYTRGMPHLPLQLALLLIPALGCCLAGTPQNVTRGDVESMYEQARAMLEDRSIQNVESVPLILETCVREQHPDATRLMLDVLEGKYKGLEANAGQACRLARELAEYDALDQVSPACRELRTEAMFRLALYLEKGNGCEANQQEACFWMQQAAQRGMPQAQVELARYLMLGKGTVADPRRAWHILHQQARMNPRTPNLFFYMGYMCAHGVGMPKDMRKAFELFRMGARLNDTRCLNNLGSMYEKGVPTPRDPESAYKLYRLAANLGNREASANMQRLAFKEGIRASHLSSTPIRKRIDNATLHLIYALPVTEESRERLRRWLLKTEEPLP